MSSRYDREFELDMQARQTRAAEDQVAQQAELNARLARLQASEEAARREQREYNRQHYLAERAQWAQGPLGQRWERVRRAAEQARLRSEMWDHAWRSHPWPGPRDETPTEPQESSSRALLSTVGRIGAWAAGIWLVGSWLFSGLGFNLLLPVLVLGASLWLRGHLDRSRRKRLADYRAEVERIAAEQQARFRAVGLWFNPIRESASGNLCWTANLEDYEILAGVAADEPAFWNITLDMIEDGEMAAVQGTRPLNREEVGEEEYQRVTAMMPPSAIELLAVWEREWQERYGSARAA